MIDLGKAYGRKPSETEAARPRDVNNRLRISGKTMLLIANGRDGTSAHLLRDIAGENRRNVQNHYGRYGRCRWKNCRNPRQNHRQCSEGSEVPCLKDSINRLVPIGLIALIYLLACGSLLFWIGFRIDTGKWRWYCTCPPASLWAGSIEYQPIFLLGNKDIQPKRNGGKRSIDTIFIVSDIIFFTSFIVKLWCKTLDALSTTR